MSSLNEPVLQEIQHYGPVTALKLHQNLVLVGYGPIFKVFQLDPETNAISLISSQRAFKRNKIHAIGVLGENKICVAGGRSFAVVDLLDKEIHEKAINEWIVACEFLDATTLLLLSSHNEVLKVDISDLSTFKFDVIEKVHCNEKSILYSGSITTTDSGNVYVAAGTVMSGVIIWDLATRQIVHELTAHEGSIFGVEISSDGKYVISCSDDRSVKLFDFQTGKLLASGWGHGSRIWSLQFISSSDTSVDIFSTGEDCSTRMWHYEESSETLTQTYLWDHCHLGKHIWSGDVSSSLGVAVTGGADGKVRVHDISNLETSFSQHTAEEVTQATGVKFEKKEALKQFAELPYCDTLVAVTSLGKVFALNTKTGSWSHVTIPDEDVASIKESGMLRAFAALNAASIFTRLGDSLTLHFGASGDLKNVEWIKTQGESPKKIINVLVDEDAKKKEYYALLDCPNPNVPLEIRKFALKNESVVVTKSLELCKPDPKVFTPTSVHYDTRNQWLLVGSRHANFAIYNLAGQQYQLPLLVRKVCPGDTITSISTVYSTDGHLVALLTVRDGTYVYMSISAEDDQFKFDIILQNKLNRGVLEGGFIHNGDLLIYGFQSSSFYIWNETKQIEVGHQHCGGAHRQWKFVRHEDDSKFEFIYLNKGGLAFKRFDCRFKTSKNGLLIGGTHGREIRGVSVSPIQEEDGTKLIATASEDAAVKLGKLDSSGNIENLWTLNNHISGLQNIAFLNHEYIVSSAANEELLVWKILRVSRNVTTIVEHSRIQVSDENPDLRIMDFASIEVAGGFWIAAVYSNSKIKVFFYDTKERSFTLSIEDTFSTICILNVNFIVDGDNKYLATGTTDGFITIWNVSEDLSTDNVSKLNKLVVLQQLHQSGVKAITIIPGNKQWSIVTGGDDNALILSRLVSTDGEVSLEIVSFVEDAASATITDLSNAGSTKVFATSVDQIVRLWDFSDNNLKCISANYTTVSDTGCCDTTHFKEKIFGVVGGAGLGIWDLSSS